MELCVCGSKAVLKCASCEVFLCQSHTASHVTDGEEHHLVKIKSKISIELKEKMLNKEVEDNSKLNSILEAIEERKNKKDE